MRRVVQALLFALLLPGATALAQDICALPGPPPGQHDRNALWRIVHCRCGPAAAQGMAPPMPCTGLAAGEQGAALLKDLVGESQYLLIPVVRVTGIEDPALLSSGAPNYFAMAWQARGVVGLALRQGLPPDALALAVNSALRRSQDQLHIHIDCIRPEARAALREAAPGIGAGWAPVGAALPGWLARRAVAEGEELRTDPFRALAAEVPGAAGAMGEWTILLTATAEPPGLLVLAGRQPESGNAERLQDHGCALAR